MFDKNEFLKKYPDTEKTVNEQNIDWKDLTDIYNDFEKNISNFEKQAEFISNLLRTADKVHTVRHRIKDPFHLIEKIIRKTKERKKDKGNDFKFTIENYKDEITDLIGIRVIHIFKNDWETIHKFIINNWEIKENTVNIRNGDDTKEYEKNGVKIDVRKTGYRSIHYLIECSPTKNKITAEIQVRTIFEEGYGEIDHLLNYPNENTDEILKMSLLLFNRVSGSLDEMASFINKLNTELKEKRKILLQKEKEITELKEKMKELINNSNMNKEEKDKIYTMTEYLSKNVKIYEDLYNSRTKFFIDNSNLLNNLQKEIAVVNPNVIENIKRQIAVPKINPFENVERQKAVYSKVFLSQDLKINSETDLKKIVKEEKKENEDKKDENKDA